jgi:hypothetical protein
LLNPVCNVLATQHSSCMHGIAGTLQCMPVSSPTSARLHAKPCSLDDDDDELEGIWQAALEGAQQSKRSDAVRSADLSALVGSARDSGFRMSEFLGTGAVA